VVAYKYDKDLVRVNIIDELQDKADRVPPPQLRDFLLRPEKCDAGQTFYRRLLPQYLEGELEKIGYRGTTCLMLYFQHAKRCGVFACISFCITVISLVIGLCICIKNKDLSGGFTVAAYGGVPLAFTIALWMKS
jgi:hypothetical protein